MRDSKGLKLEIFFLRETELEYFETNCKYNFFKKCVREKIFMSPTAILVLPSSERAGLYFPV